MARAGTVTLSSTAKTAAYTNTDGIKPTTVKVKNANASAGNINVYINGEIADVLEPGDQGYYRPAGGVSTIEVEAASTATVIYSAGVVQL